MKYYKTIEDGYITQIGINTGGTEITEEEYFNILAVVKARPTPPDGYGYKLKTDLTWEQYELPPEPDEVDDAEALDILLGGAT